MLKPWNYVPPTAEDQLIFEAIVPADHYLRQVKQHIDFERCRSSFTDCYHPSLGRSAKEPVLLLKLQFLQLQYNLSDRQVIAQTQVNMAFRFFLDLSLRSALPDPSLLSVFRTRLGPDRYQQVFDDILAQARAHGLVKDRLRLKDATHVIANIAVPSTLRLVAQTRQQLLDALRPFDPQRVADAEAQAQAIRTATADLTDEERLLQRVTHLQALVAWADNLLTSLPPQPEQPEPNRQRLEQALQLAHQVLADRADPDKGDRVVSVHDPDARHGKHGRPFTGYLVDIAEDADSELITRVHVLPGNADEAADAGPLLAEEEQTHGNDVAELSIDGAGFRGDLLRQWQDPQGLGLEVTVPPSPEPEETGRFTPEQFTVLDAEQGVLGCPAGQQTRQRRRNAHDTGWKYHFPGKTCAGCPLREACMGGQPNKSGRTVIKNDYEAEYRAARQRAQTPEHQQVRRQHRRVERKLAELVRWHGGRRARYRGRGRVLAQYLLSAVVVNVKRMVRLLQGDGAHAAVAGACG